MEAGCGSCADTVQPMRLRLIRHATLELDYAGRRLLLDPMLDPGGRAAAVGEHAERPPQPARRAPRAGRGDRGAGGGAARHPPARRPPRRDRGGAAGRRPAAALPAARRGHAARARVHRRAARSRTTLELDGLQVSRTGGQHGTGEIAEMLAPVSGFVLRADGEPTVYVAGDTIWCDEVRVAIDEHAPDVVVVNAERRALQRGRPDRHDRRRTSPRSRATRRGARSSPSTSRRSTTASSRARPCADLPRQRARGRCRCAIGRHRHGPMSPRPQPSSGQIGQK